MRLIFHAEARCLSRGKVLGRVFQLWQELRVLLAQHGYPISTDLAILTLFGSEFSVMDRAAVYVRRN